MQKQYRNSIVAFVLAITAGSIAAFPSFAEDQPATAAAESSAPRLQGGVVQVQVTLNDLQDARLSTSRVRKAAANLYDEVNRQEVAMGYNPNVIGTTVIMAPAPRFTGRMLPARKKWVDESMKEIGPIMTLFKEDVDQAIEDNRRTDVSEATKKSLDPLRDTAFSTIKNAFETYKQLEQLTTASNYDNSAISTAAKTLDSQMKGLDKSLKDGIKILQREAKAARRNKAA
jgi:hypothetical protein